MRLPVWRQVPMGTGIPCTALARVAIRGEKRKKEHLITLVIVSGATFRLYSKHTGLL